MWNKFQRILRESDLVKRIHWTPQLVNKFWDGIAQTELDDLSFGKVAGPKFIELIGNFLIPGGRHLDFGAGSGHVLQLLLDRGLDAAGFDPSPDRQALLVEKVGDHKHFLGIKGTDSTEQFDVVLLMEVVEHVLDEDLREMLARVARFVKPGGYLIASTPNNENLEYSSVYCPVSDTFFHPWQHVRSFTPHQLSDCFGNFGFSSQFVALVDFSSDVELVEAYKRMVAIESSIKKYQLLLTELDQFDAVLRSGTPLGLWQRIKRRMDLLWRHRTLIMNLHSLAHDMFLRLDEVTNHSREELKYTMTSIPKNGDRSTQESDGIDLRIGRETTIVYVGKKK